MKAHTVKSNAKRFARGLADKYSGVTPVEPVPTDCSKSAWFAAVTAENLDYADAVAEFAVVINRKDLETPGEIPGWVEVPPSMEAAAATIDDVFAANRALEAYTGAPVIDAGNSTFRTFSAFRHGKQAVADAISEQMLDEGKTVATFSQGSAELRGAGAAKDITPATGAGLRPYQQEIIDAVKNDAAATERTMKAAVDLPPPVKSTREEIDARREERRQRIDAEKAAGTRDAAGNKVEPKKISKKKILIDLMKREGGATQQELESATGWQRHTLRGYIAGTLRKKLGAVGFSIDCKRGSGEMPTRYAIVAASADEEGGAA